MKFYNQIQEPKRVSYVLQQRQKRNQDFQSYKVGEVNNLDNQQIKQKILTKEEKPKDLLKSRAGIFNYGEEDKSLYQRRPIAYEGEQNQDKNDKQEIQYPDVDSPKEIREAHQHIHQRSNKDVFMPYDQQYGFCRNYSDKAKDEHKNIYKREQDTLTDEQISKIRAESRKMYKRNKSQTRTDDLF